jgi:uncharacterized protein
MTNDLVVHLARFGGALRTRGVDVGVGDDVDAARALAVVGLADREDVRRALRIAFKIRVRDWSAFDELFDRVWSASPRTDIARNRAAAMRTSGGGAPLNVPRAVEERETEMRSMRGTDGVIGYSPDAVLRRKPFDECSDADLAAMERLVARAARRLATCRSRRLVPSRRREVVDLRHSLRRAIDTGGELVSLAYRARASDRPRLVVLCDTSGSMDRHARFLLAFVVALRRVARNTEVFVFNTSLTRVTPAIASGRIARTLRRLASGVPDWSVGTKIGESLSEFVARHLDRFVTHKSIVIVVSDGLDRGDTSLVADAMRAIRSRARRVIWLNPLAGDPRYEPTARAMAAARPFIDRLLPAHDLASLEHVLPNLS